MRRVSGKTPTFSNLGLFGSRSLIVEPPQVDISDRTAGWSRLKSVDIDAIKVSRLTSRRPPGRVVALENLYDIVAGTPDGGRRDTVDFG